MINWRCILSAILLLGHVLPTAGQLPPPPAPVSLRAVQVGAERIDQGGEPQSLRAEVEALGFGPYWEHDVDEGERGVWRYSLVGKLDSLTDAIILKHQLRRVGFSDAYERSFPSLVTSDFEAEVQSPALPVFSPQVHSYPSTLTTPPMGLLEAFSDLETLEDPDLEEIAVVFPALDIPMSEKKRLACVLAREMTRRLSISHDLMRQTPVTEVQSIVNDKIFPILLPAASSEQLDGHTLEARWIAATIWHEYLRDRIVAYRAFRQIVNDHGGEDPAVRARGFVSLAAVSMELARSKGAYFNESRRLSCIAHAVVPQEFESARATAELMYWETFYFEGKHELVVDGLTGFASRYPTAWREIAGAHWAVALSQDALGKPDEALDAIRELLAMPLSSSDMFHWAGRRNNIQLWAVDTLRQWTARDDIRVDSDVEDLLKAILERPAAEESFSSAFSLEVLERTASPANE